MKKPKLVQSALCLVLGAAVAMAAGAETAVELPEGYTAVEYIESTTGGGQYINTGYKPNLSTVITAEFYSMTRSQGWGVFFGVTGNDSSLDGILLRYYDNSNDLNGWFCNSDWGTPRISDDFANKDLAVELKANSLTINGTSYGIDTTGAPYDGPIYLFCGYNDAEDGKAWRHQAMRLYSFKITEGEEVKRNFVPCVRESDLAVGLYDTASKEFYANAGSGAFGVPSDIFCTVTVGPLANMTAAYTFGNGSVTNAVGGESFRVLKGQAGVKVIFTANEGYVLDGSAVVDVAGTNQGEVNIAGSVPTAERLPAFVTVTSAKQRWPWNGKVDVGYTLSNTDAGEYYRLITAVTVDGATKSVTNEVGAVSDGNYKTTVDCAALFGAGVLAPASVTMAVRTYSAPAVKKAFVLDGPFMVIDLTKDDTGKFPHQEYATTAELPPGAWNLENGWSDDYKTKYLVMRKVKAGEAYPCEPNASEFPIKGTMTPTKDYWIGVHQVTQEQYARVMGDNLPTSDNAKPKSNISWNTIRGSAGITTEITKDSAECFMQQLCKKTNLAGFDLPTEAQWEIAARAGSAEEYGAYVDENGCAVKGTSDNIGDFAIYSGNKSTYGSPGAVGQLRPNLWGLYDTAGNVWEWCRDCNNGRDPADVESPRVPSEGDSSRSRVIRGGCYYSDAVDCRPSNRGSGSAGIANDYIGFRLSRICDDPDAQNTMFAAAALAAVAYADDPPTVKLPFAPGDTLAYSHDGCEPVRIEASTSPVVLELGRNGHYAFYSNGVVMAERDVSGLGTTVTEPNWATGSVIFTLDTQETRTFDLSGGVVTTNLTYSGTGWGEPGAGTSATIKYRIGEGDEATLADGLTGTGETAWTPTANGTFTLKHISGDATETATITVENLTTVTITVGDLAAKHLTGKVVWNGTETPVEGTSFVLPKGGTGAKLVLTAESGYRPGGSLGTASPTGDGRWMVEVSLDDLIAEGGTVSIADDIPAAVEYGFRLLGVTNRYPWNGKMDISYALTGTDAAKYYRLVTSLTVGNATKQVTSELGQVTDGGYTNTVDCAALFGTEVTHQEVTVKLALQAYDGPLIKVAAVGALAGPFLIIDLTPNANGKFLTTECLVPPEGAWTEEKGWTDDYKSKYLVLRKVPAGTFPGANVQMKETASYWIGVFEVTEAQYDRVMGAWSPSDSLVAKGGISYETIRGTSNPSASVAGNSFMKRLCDNCIDKDGKPVTGFDLPTELQWSIAYYGGRKGGRFYWGDESSSAGQYAWSSENSDGNVQKVGQKLPNAWGLYDIAGNVWEWCRDGVVGDADSRPLRGGSFDYNASYCNGHYRNGAQFDDGSNDFGFRLSRMSSNYGTANAENRIVIDIEAGDTLSYTVNGSQEVRIDLSSCAGATALVVDLLPNGEYAFTLKDAWGGVKRVYRASLTDAASGEQTESEEGAAMLDTRTERTISGDEAETLTYSGNGWGAGGSGVTVGYSLEGGAEQTLMTATDSGTVSWTPTLSGRYEFRHAVEGGGSDTAVFVVNELPGREEKPWEIGEGVTAYVKNHVVYLQGEGEVDEFAGDAPWAEYEKQGCQLVGAYLPRTVTLPASVLATMPFSVKGGAQVPSGAVSGAEFEQVQIVGGKAYLGVSVCTNSEVKVIGEGEDGGWQKAAIEGAQVEEDGTVTLTVPATAEKGFMFLKSKGADHSNRSGRPDTADVQHD